MRTHFISLGNWRSPTKSDQIRSIRSSNPTNPALFRPHSAEVRQKMGFRTPDALDLVRQRHRVFTMAGDAAGMESHAKPPDARDEA
jgi:hypothetical protein